ncbi:HNH endonuclease signature motif containing protein [Terrabacter aerolatus]|uniref:HNH endonuclease n=1 Tax=Terrabacter aerolatus TaxID=422442 RepID=A0A512CXA4_9MICO|nr:HNH endonuclease signature motif containing protein [Terrabacter aerolatus]GEO28835.1 HNH endonuclease [Terrabacter aerolatus]
MFDDAPVLTTQGLEALVSALSQVGSGSDSDHARIDQLAVLERLKSAAAAAQVRVTAAFVDSQGQVAQAWSQRASECSDAGDFDGWRAARNQARAASFADQDNESQPPSEPGAADHGARSQRRRRPSGMTGIAAQVALARHESPVQGAGHVRLALALTRDLPHTLAALEAGELSEWRAQIIVRETAVLTPADRRVVDAEVIGSVDHPVGMLGDRELAQRVRAVAYRIDAASVTARAAKAETDRRVTLRPAPDTMAYLTALLPVAQAVAAHAALTTAADTARAAGDERGKGQVMADTLVTRLTGQDTPGAVPVEIQLVMTDRALLGDDDTPAHLTGHGPVPAAWVRDLLTRLRHTTDPAAHGATRHDTGHDTGHEAGHDTGHEAGHEAGNGTGRGAEAWAASVWLRRLFTHPTTGTLVGMDSVRRTFDGGLRRYLLTRDAATCRTPWCDAPARHLDHIEDHAHGGPTTATNGQALCVRCNHTKQLPGFTATTDINTHTDTITGRQLGAPHTVRTTTPTGHSYTSHAPPLLSGLPPQQPRGPAEPDMLSPLEHALTLALAA